MVDEEGIRRLSLRLLLGWGRRCLDVVGQPGQALEQALARRRATGHDVPDLVFQF